MFISILTRDVHPPTAMAQPFPSPFLFLPSPLSPSPPFPSLLPLLFHPLSPCPSFPSFLSLDVGLLNPARKPGERCKPPPLAGSGAEAQPKSNLVHFSFKIWHLVVAFSMIFLKINLLNFVQFKQYQGKSRPRRTYHALFCSKQYFSVFTTVNINSLNTNMITKWWKTTTFQRVYAVFYLNIDLLCVWIRHFISIKLLH